MTLARHVLVALLFAVVAVEKIRAQGGDDEIAYRVRSMAGRVERDYERPGRPVVSVWLGHHAIADGNLGFLRKARHLRRLALESAKITDASAEELARFTAIEELELRSRRITGKTLKQIGAMTQLKTLSIWSPNFKDKDLAHLSTLVKLTSLSLNDCDLGDEALVQLGPLPNLVWIEIAKTRVTDAAIPTLLAMPKLEYVLGSFQCNMTEPGWERLREALAARRPKDYRESPGFGAGASGPQVRSSPGSPQ